MDWLRGFLPFSSGIPTAQTLRKVFRLLDTQALQRGFAAWAASLRAEAREVIAVNGKTLRGSKTSPDGKGALHVVSACATAAGLVIAQRAVDGKSNEITAIPELLDLLNLKGAIVSIDAIGTQKEIARRIIDEGADYVLASKATKPACTKTRRCSSPIRSAPLPARRAPRRMPGTAGSKSAVAALPRRVGSPSAIRSGRVYVPWRPSPPGASTRRPAAKASKPATTSPPSNPIPRPFSPQRVRLGHQPAGLALNPGKQPVNEQSGHPPQLHPRKHRTHLILKPSQLRFPRQQRS